MSTLASAAAVTPSGVRTGGISNSRAPAPGQADGTSQSMRRVALASMVATAIECYDYFIFGTAAALVFGQVFFLQLGGGNGVLAASAAFAVAFAVRPIGSVLFGHLAGCAALIGWSLAMFPLIGTGSPMTLAVGIVVLLALVGLAYGPIGAHLPETFPTDYRYTGTGLTYNLGGVAGGAVAVLVAPALAASSAGTLAIGVYLAVMLISTGCMLALPETRDASLTHPGGSAARSSTR
jgi:MFS family permease